MGEREGEKKREEEEEEEEKEEEGKEREKKNLEIYQINPPPIQQIFPVEVVSWR